MFEWATSLKKGLEKLDPIAFTHHRIHPLSFKPQSFQAAGADTTTHYLIPTGGRTPQSKILTPAGCGYKKLKTKKSVKDIFTYFFQFFSLPLQ